MLKRRRLPRLSVVVNFHNMRREAERTLFSLTVPYQRGVAPRDYEVIAVDNGSARPLDPHWVRSFGPNFKHVFFATDSPSPCGALNFAVGTCRGELVTCNIDGARILSPGILKFTLLAAGLSSHPFIYTLGMHLGPRPQKYLIPEGYNEEREDRLLETVDWRRNGYELFSVSSVAPSSGTGFFSDLSESNCFTLRREDFIRAGGFDPGFHSPGGGLANLDFFNRMNEREDVTPVMLLGEATFHQFHGGVATNAPLGRHPWDRFVTEYEAVRGRPYAAVTRRPVLFGHLPPECHALVKSSGAVLAIAPGGLRATG